MKNALGFDEIGIGVGLRTPYYDLFYETPPKSVSWLEAVTENFMPLKKGEMTAPLEKLLKFRRNLPVVLHGVSMSLGSTDPIDKNYLKNLKSLISTVQPAWVSDHLCWGSFRGVNFHDLYPLPYSEEALKNVARKISQIQDFLGHRILVENVSSYANFESSEMSEWEFVAELANEADCGLLLDVNNVYVSSRNHGFDPFEYLRAIPTERIGQIHLAGHSDHGTHIVDTHDEAICEPVWKLYEWCTQRWGKISGMIERDDNFPTWTELENELVRMKRIYETDRKIQKDKSQELAAVL